MFPFAIAGVGLSLGAAATAIVKALTPASELFAVVWLERRKVQPHRYPKTTGVHPYAVSPGMHAGMARHEIHKLRDEPLVVEHRPHFTPTESRVVGRTFATLEEATTFQNILATKHHTSSIIVHQAADGALSSQSFIRAVTAPSPAAVRGVAFTNSHPNFDTRAVALDTMNVSTRTPAPEWAVRARLGPYPDRDVMYSDTPSSHMYDVDVETLVVPSRFSPGTTFKPGPTS